MKISLAVIVGLLSVCNAAERSKRQAIIFGNEPRPSEADCSDFQGAPGVCGPLRQCSQWLRIVSNNPSPRDIHNLRRSICGQEFQGGRQVPLICCARGGGSGPVNPPFPQTPRPQTPRPQTPRPQTPRPQTPRPQPQTPRPQPQTPSPGGQSGGDPERHVNRRLVPQDNACGTTIVDRIVGGEETELGAYPWLAVLGYSVAPSNEVEFNCGGALINERYVLTAAHCVTNLPSRFRLSVIRLGEHDTRTDIDCKTRDGQRDCAEPVQDFSPEQVISHNDYNSPETFWNDIALIRLNRPVNKNAYVSPICLPFGEYGSKDYVNDRLWVAGFGLTEAFGSASEVLMHLRVPVISNQQCQSVFTGRARINDNQMCAGGESDRDSCSGDSGGPLMGLSRFGPPYRIVGVVSFGTTRCGTRGVPGVYTRVGRYLNWVLDNIRP